MDQRVADMKRLVRSAVGCFQGRVKNRLIGFAIGKVAADKHPLEKRGEPGGDELGPLHCWHAVGEHAEMEMTSQVLQQGQRVRI